MSTLDPAQPPGEDTPQLPPDWHYETTVNDIEVIIEQIEVGDLDLADVFDQFAQAVKYLKQCDLFLASRQEQMDLMIEQLGDEIQL